MNLERIKKVFETEFNIISLTDKTNETDNVLARCCFYTYLVRKCNLNYANIARLAGAKPETVRYSIVNFDRYCFEFSFLKNKFERVSLLIDGGEISIEEKNYILSILEDKEVLYDKVKLILTNI
jgi:hypothetical protein